MLYQIEPGMPERFREIFLNRPDRAGGDSITADDFHHLLFSYGVQSTGHHSVIVFWNDTR